MTYTDLLKLFYRAGFQRVERDDRLLDIFPHEEREKGVELWERWDAKTVMLFRLHAPFTSKGIELYLITRTSLEKLLLDNQKSELKKFGPLFQGIEAVQYLQRKAI